jgi:hypothetical protein
MVWSVGQAVGVDAICVVLKHDRPVVGWSNDQTVFLGSGTRRSISLRTMPV